MNDSAFMDDVVAGIEEQIEQSAEYDFGMLRNEVRQALISRGFNLDQIMAVTDQLEPLKPELREKWRWKFQRRALDALTSLVPGK
jgi:hypothetical protein